MRRVVTGQRPDGKSVFVSDEEIPMIKPELFGGNEINQIWQGDTPPKLPTDGTPPSGERFFPPDGGYRFQIFTMPPITYVPPPIADLDAAVAESERLLPGVTEAVTDKEGMHASDTLDWLYIVDGEVTLTLDSGEETVLRKGDSIIQSGTAHAWSNRSEAPVTLLLAMLGGSRAGGGGH